MHRLHEKREHFACTPSNIHQTLTKHCCGMCLSSHLTKHRCLSIDSDDMVKKMRILWAVCTAFIHLVTCHEELISDGIELVPRRGLKITYTPTAVTTVPTVIECGVLCVMNPCCIGATFDDSNKYAKICSMYDILLVGFITKMDHSTYISPGFNKGESLFLIM